LTFLVEVIEYTTVYLRSAIFQVDLGYPVPECLSILDFIGAKDDEGGGDNGSYKTCKAPVKSSALTCHHPNIFADRMPFLSPNQQCQSTEGKNITFHGLAYPKLTYWSSNFVSDH